MALFFIKLRHFIQASLQLHTEKKCGKHLLFVKKTNLSANRDSHNRCLRNVKPEKRLSSVLMYFSMFPLCVIRTIDKLNNIL